MLPANICRTCAQQTENLLALSTRAEIFANKSFSDMLQELMQIDVCLVPERIQDNLPQHLCGSCLRKLQGAYDFVRQARQVQEQLLLKLNCGLHTQCLEEMPIDIKVENVLDRDSQEETMNVTSFDEAATMVYTDALKWQPEADSESGQTSDENDLELKPMVLRRSTRKVKPSTDSENEASDAQVPTTTVKRRRGRPSIPDQTASIIVDGRHVCKVCGKSYSWYRDLQRHARIHFDQAAYTCNSCGKNFVRKDKYTSHLRSHEKREAKSQTVELSSEWCFAERLYSSDLLKRVQCKLCGLKCQRIQELRQHMVSHVTVDTLSSLSVDSDVIREHFASEQLHVDLSRAKQQVCAEIATGREHLDKYCEVVNAYGYELCLSDSDEDEADITPAYQCLPCQIFFTRKHRLIRHTVENHTQATAAVPSSRCSHCQIAFGSAQLLEQHQRTQCFNQLKRYSCNKCPGKFIWPKNLNQHDCLQRTGQKHELQRNHRQYQCCLCDVQLRSMQSLRTHLLTHRDGYTGIDLDHKAAFFRCFYPNGLPYSTAELSKRIATDFEIEDYGRYFNACASNGQELDFLASDTDLSDAEQTADLAPYSCSLCGDNILRLTNLLLHQKIQHNKLETTMPHVCVDCGLGFVAESLLQQHRRRVCAKQHANFRCQSCDYRFTWESNYKQHMLVEHETAQSVIDESKRQLSSVKLQCDECEKVFVWPKDLTRHKRIHQPQSSALYECEHCERKFHRKDGLKSHMRVHGEAQVDETMTTTLQRVPAMMSQLCGSNGCKQIQCMICLSQHTKISDLRTHLQTHQFTVKFMRDLDKPEVIARTCQALYPELNTPLKKSQLIERIQTDVAKGVELERFFSITNESGIELSLDSSETETDSDSADSKKDSRLYSCELCHLQVPRRYQLFAHQFEKHAWQEASWICTHCQFRFVNQQLLEHHYRTLCRNTQKRFLCRKCPFRFRWRENLKLHMDVAHEDTIGDQASLGIQLKGACSLPTVSYNCTECSRSFKMQKDLTRHSLMHAHESSIYRCLWCARRFYRQTNLLQHIWRHGISAAQLPYAEALVNASRHLHGQKCIECKVCDERYPTIAALRTHLLSVSAGTHHKIDSMLNYSITNQLGYELHLYDSETDEESKPPGVPTHYTCSMCQLRCVRKFELHQHQQAMHRLERIPTGCDQCIFKSVSSDIIAYHRLTLCGNKEKQFKCTKCSYMFMWESNLLLHMQLQHSSSEGQQNENILPVPHIHSADCQIFKCGQCPRKYNRKDRLTAHVKKFHLSGGPSCIAATKKSKSAPAAVKQQKTFLCPFCGKAVSSSSNLVIHIRRHTGEKPFKCDFCEMAFPRSSDLQCHRRTHTGERPHVCTVCQKGFARSYKLQQHMRIHSGERPYKCNFCDKSFTQSNDLTLHIRRHTGERPYQCNTCGERFIQGTALKNHRLQNGHFEPEEDDRKTS